MNQITLKIFGCIIRFFSQHTLHNATAGRAGGFVVSDHQASTPHYVIEATIGTAALFEMDCESTFTGESFENNILDYKWSTGKKGSDEILRIDFNAPNDWKTIEASIGADNNIKINHIPGCQDEIPAINPYVFPFTSLLLSKMIHRMGGTLIHASGVNDNGKGYIFTAVSGTGKSTMAGLWRQRGATIINDDIIAITTHDGPLIHNIPMPYYDDKAKQAPLRAVCIIRQSPHNYFVPLTGAKAAMLMMANCIQQLGTRSYVEKHLQIISTIASAVPIYEVGFKPDTDIVDLIRDEIG